jgi:hypothetical protein
MKKKLEWDISYPLNMAVIVIGIFSSLIGFDMYWSGYHDLDMAQNLIFLRDSIHQDLYDSGINFVMGTYAETTTTGAQITLEEMYYNGVLRLKQSVFIIIGGMFSLGYGLRGLR